MKILLIGAAGYIGSSLHRALLEHEHQVTACDAMWFGCPSGLPVKRRRYQDFSRDELAKFEAVCLLAGHSSVGMSVNDRKGTLNNNLYDPIDLIEKLDPAQTFIYASSSSVYSGYQATLATETMPMFPPQNVYDYTKAAFDSYLALRGERRYYGLRFGTVNGVSPSIRWDLMINSMTRSALKDGRIAVFNGHVHRPILGLRDLVRAILRTLEVGGEPGLYNLASFNAQVASVAAAVAAITKAEVVQRPPTPTYDFSISCEKFEREFDFRFEETAETLVADIAKVCLTNQHFERRTNVFTSFEQMSGVQ